MVLLQWHGQEPVISHFRDRAVPSGQGFGLRERPQLPLEQTSRRKVYPYSVIAGGVLTRQELLEELAHDGVAAEHYSNFQARRAQVVRLEKDLSAHLSYRLRNKVYWTAKKINLKRGETLITDGTDFARTRCGNRISVLAQEPTSPEEPTAESFELPIVPEEAPSRLETAEFPLPAAGRLQVAEFPVYPPERPRFDWPYRPVRELPPSTYSFPPPESPTVVPEPGSLTLLGSGLAIGYFLMRRRRNGSNR
jgi:hypothetical protein